MFRDGDPLVVAVVVSDVVLAAARVDGGDASGEETPLALPPHGDATSPTSSAGSAPETGSRGRRASETRRLTSEAFLAETVLGAAGAGSSTTTAATTTAAADARAVAPGAASSDVFAALPGLGRCVARSDAGAIRPGVLLGARVRVLRHDVRLGGEEARDRAHALRVALGRTHLGAAVDVERDVGQRRRCDDRGRYRTFKKRTV